MGAISRQNEARWLAIKGRFTRTDVDGVALNYGTAEERFLDSMTISKARQYLGESGVIASLDNAWKALQGEAGTKITP